MSLTVPDADAVLDARGQVCPHPVIELAKVLPTLPVGAVLAVVADDPAAAADVPAWCRLRGQEYVGARPTAGGQAFLVRRVS